MNLMLCLTGEEEQLPFLPEIATLGAGIELGSYGLIGVRSEQDWQTRLARHRAVRDQFQGAVAIHGPFLGMEYAHTDHLIRDAVHRRLDMTLDVAADLRAHRVVLHSGYTRDIDLFKLEDAWLETNVAFWSREIRRWADAGVTLVLENDTDMSPDMVIRLVDQVDNPYLRLCLDIGHLHVFSNLDAVEWVRRMGSRLVHIHLHDNDGTDDSHQSLGRGTIHFEPFYTAVMMHAPRATISLELKEPMDVKINDLRKLAARFAS